MTVAILDSGLWAHGSKAKFVTRSVFGLDRVLAQYDATVGQEIDVDSNSDDNGHGTHLASIIASTRMKDGYPKLVRGSAGSRAGRS